MALQNMTIFPLVVNYLPFSRCGLPPAGIKAIAVFDVPSGENWSARQAPLGRGVRYFGRAESCAGIGGEAMKKLHGDPLGVWHRVVAGRGGVGAGNIVPAGI